MRTSITRWTWAHLLGLLCLNCTLSLIFWYFQLCYLHHKQMGIRQLTCVAITNRYQLNRFKTIISDLQELDNDGMFWLSVRKWNCQSSHISSMITVMNIFIYHKHICNYLYHFKIQHASPYHPYNRIDRVSSTHSINYPIWTDKTTLFTLQPSSLFVYIQIHIHIYIHIYRMSFEETTQFKSKATKFLGVAGDASSSNGLFVCLLLSSSFHSSQIS